jgi:hypothetical protein
MRYTIILLFIIIIGFQPFNLTARTLFIGKQQPVKTLQQALDQVEGGDRILIQAGTYISDKPINILEKYNLEIIGQGEVNLYTDSTYDEVLTIASSEKIHLKNLHMRHTNPPKNTVCVGEVVLISNCSNITLESCEIDGCGLFGIRAYSCTKIVIQDCFIHNNANSALDMDTIDGLSLFNNTITDNGDLFFSKRNITNMIMENNTMQLDLDYQSLEELEDAYWTAMDSNEKIYGVIVKMELVLLEKSNKEIVLKPSYSSQHFYLEYPSSLQATIDDLDVNRTYIIIFKVSYAEMSMLGLLFSGEILEIH